MAMKHADFLTRAGRRGRYKLNDKQAAVGL